MARLLLFVLVALAAGPLVALPVGSLASLEGEVSVLRTGVVIPSEKIADGFALEPYDTVVTGSTGRAEVRLAGAFGVAGALRLDPSTALYLDLSAQKKEQVVGVELLSGAVSVRLTAVTGASAVEVRTDAGFFVGAAPAFRVITLASGDVLATTANGKVSCVGPGRTVFIEPGTVVQVQGNDLGVQTVPVNVSTLDAYETSWVRQRTQLWKDQAAVAFRTQATRYQGQLGQFQRAWERYQREGNDATAGRAALAQLRRAAFPLERSFPRVRALKTLLDAGLLPATLELTRGYVVKDFFRQAQVDDGLWGPRLAEARGAYKALADRWGSFPSLGTTDAITGDTDYFH